jgi:ABC-type multidrug transport system fused ATPase/permease subunit
VSRRADRRKEARTPKSAGVQREAKTAMASDSEGRALSWSTFARSLQLLRGYGPPCVTVFVLSLVLVGASVWTPKIGQHAIDRGVRDGNLAILNYDCLLLVALTAFQLVGGYIQGLLFNRLGQSAMDRLRRRVFAHMQYLSIGFYERREPGKIISRITSDIDSVNELLRLALMGVAQDFLKAIGISVILFVTNWKMGLLLHAVLPPIIVVMVVFRKQGERVFRRIRETVAGISTYLHETITGIRVVKSFSREPRNTEVFAELTEQNARANIAQGWLFGMLFPVVHVLGLVSSVVGVFWYGCILMRRGELEPGGLLALYTYAGMLIEPWRSLSEMAANVQRAGVALDRIYEVLDEEPTVRDREGAVELPPVTREIRFEDVRFEYLEGKEILHGVSFSARPGEVVAIVGPTGAGKSTIIKLLARLYEVSGGRITFDGADIRDGTIASVRRQVGLVPQDSFLFAGTVAENIAYGLDRDDRAAIERAAAATHVTRFADRLPLGLDTPIHERGVRLSDGERQLLSLARAVAAESRILILDEATSSIDLFTEASVQEALEEVGHSTVTFVVAHRLATVRKATRILVLEDGRVKGMGSHRELMRDCDLYRGLYLRRFEDLTEEERLAREKRAAEA